MIEKKKPSDEIIDLANVEHRNVERYMKRLGEHMELFEVLVSTTSTLFPLTQKVLLKKDEELRYAVITNLYALMMQDVLKGMVNFTKGYVTDASFQSRRILESAALAIEMYRKPKKIKYYTTLETEKDFSKYLDNFKVFVIIQNTLSKEAQDDYARLCYSVHPSALAIGDRVSLSERLEHTIKFNEYIEDEDTPKLKRQFLIFILTMFHGFRDFVSELKAHPDFDWKKAEKALAKFDALWISHRAKLATLHPELLQDI